MAVRSLDDIRREINVAFPRQKRTTEKGTHVRKSGEQGAFKNPPMDAHTDRISDANPSEDQKPLAARIGQGEVDAQSRREHCDDCPTKDASFNPSSIAVPGLSVDEGSRDTGDTGVNVEHTASKKLATRREHAESKEGRISIGVRREHPPGGSGVAKGEKDSMSATKHSSGASSDTAGAAAAAGAPSHEGQDGQDIERKMKKMSTAAALGNVPSLDDKVRGLGVLPATTPPLPCDVSRVTLELACSPPPYNLRRTVRVKDHAKDKQIQREELTSALREAWERMLVRDVATAGGIADRQVCIEEIRRGFGSFPAVPAAHLPGTAASLSPFRPDQRDGTNLRYRPSQTLTPPTARNLGDGSVTATTHEKFIVISTHNGRELGKVGGCTGGDEPFVVPFALQRPAAGLRATLTRRLFRTGLKRTRRKEWRKRGGGGRVLSFNFGVDLLTCVGPNVAESFAIENEPDATSVHPETGKFAVADADHICDDTNQARSSGSFGDRVPEKMDSCASRALANARVRQSSATATRSTTAPGQTLSVEPEILPGRSGVGTAETQRKPEQGVGAIIRAVGGGSEPADLFKGLRFADRSAAGTVVYGIGAGNRSDWGILGRTTGRVTAQRGLRQVDHVLFNRAEGDQKADPRILEALQQVKMTDRHLNTWQAKDTIMKALDPFERIPTQHELKLAARVERARALFGPGGYLSPLQSVNERTTPLTPELVPRPSLAVAVTGESEPRPSTQEDVQILKRKSTVPPITKSIQAPLGARATKTIAYCEASPAMADEQKDTVSAIPIASRSGAASVSAFAQKPVTELFARNDGATVAEGTKTVGQKPTTGRGTAAMSCHSTWLALRTTIVTLTIVGGRPDGRGFTNLQQRDKTPSETVAQHIALQIRHWASDLLRGGLTHTTVSARWCPAGRARVLDTWEGYWCHRISPVYFGRSTRSRRATKAAARRRHELRALNELEVAAAKREVTRQAAATEASAEAFPDEASDGPNSLEGAALVITSSAARKRSTMSLNEQLEEAEVALQAFLSEGLVDGGHMNPQQYHAFLVRDRAIKKVLLRRKLSMKRKGGELLRKRFLYRRLPSGEIRGWKDGIAAEDRVHRAERRAEAARRQEDRMAESRKRGESCKLRAWLMRYLVASYGGSDLMAKAIALQDQANSLAFVGPAARGAVGRESSLLGRETRPGGRFAYGAEASADHLAKADRAIKARRRFEQETDVLLRHEGILTFVSVGFPL